MELVVLDYSHFISQKQRLGKNGITQTICFMTFTHLFRLCNMHESMNGNELLT